MSIFPPEALATLRGDLVSILEQQGKDLLQGAAADLQRYVIAIGNDMARALLLPEPRREALMQELASQLRAVGEINRIRATNEAWETFERVVTTAGSVLLRTAVAAAVPA